MTPTPTGRDVPAQTRDSPPVTRDTTSTSCIVCDVNYNCASPRGNGPNGLQLRASDGTCNDTIIALICSGSPFGAASCSGGGGGPFTCGDTVCSPSQQSAPISGGSGAAPPSGGGGSGTSSASGAVVDGG